MFITFPASPRLKSYKFLQGTNSNGAVERYVRHGELIGNPNLLFSVFFLCSTEV